MLQFPGSAVTSDAGWLAYRELDDALGLTAMAGETLADARTGKNGCRARVGLLRQSVFGRLEKKVAIKYESVEEVRAGMLERGFSPRFIEAMEATMQPKFLRKPDQVQMES